MTDLDRAREDLLILAWALHRCARQMEAFNALVRAVRVPNHPRWHWVWN